MLSSNYEYLPSNAGDGRVRFLTEQELATFTNEKTVILINVGKRIFCMLIPCHVASIRKQESRDLRPHHPTEAQPHHHGFSLPSSCFLPIFLVLHSASVLLCIANLQLSECFIADKSCSWNDL